MEKKPDETVTLPVVTGGAGTKRRPRYSAPEKLGLLAEAESPGGSISLVARKYGVATSQLFRWRHLRDAGSLTGLQAREAVVAESEAQKLRTQVRELQRLLGQKTEEVEVLRAAIPIAREKKLLSPAVLNRGRRLEGKPPVNHKRIYRLMAANQLLLERNTGKPVRTHEARW